MKIKYILLAAAALVATLAPTSSANAQGTMNFTWNQDNGGNVGTILTTATVTNTQNPTTALDLVTTYQIEFTINGDDSLSISRQSIDHSSLGAAAAYFAGPVTIQNAGTMADFSAWLNSNAQTGSSESIYNIIVNGVPLSQTVTANASTPIDSFEYVSPNPIDDIKFDYAIVAVSAPGETGIGVSMPLTVGSVPEPSTLALLGLALAAGIVTKRKY